MISRQSAEKIPEILSACDVAFLSFAEDDLWTKTIPAKLQSYMACGMPIIASAEGETARIINESGCGLCSELGNAEKLSHAIMIMESSDLADMGKKSREYFEKHFEKNMLMNQMEHFLMN